MQRCPVCETEVPASPRYPRKVCTDCVKRARTNDDRPVAFFNQALSGGLEGRYADNGEEYPLPDCTIDGVPCRAEEARFGGVVIQVIGDGEKRRYGRVGSW